MKKIILLCLLISALLLFSGCKEKVEEQETPEVPEEPSIPEQEQAPLEQGLELEMITEARCIDNKIQLVMTNPTEEALVIGKTAKIILNGIVMIDSECDKYTIEPGASSRLRFCCCWGRFRIC